MIDEEVVGFVFEECDVLVVGMVIGEFVLGCEICEGECDVCWCGVVYF